MDPLTKSFSDLINYLLLELVKAMEDERIAIPVVLMTGNPSPELLAALPREVEVLTKPLTEKTLQELLGV